MEATRCLLTDERIQKFWYPICIQWNITQLLKKECIWVCPNEVDEPRAYCAEWSKSERERQILYINAYIYVYIHIYMESRKMVLMNLFAGQQWRRRHREQTYGHSRGRRGWDVWRAWHGNIYTIICKTASGNLLCDVGSSTQGSVTTYGGERGLQEEGTHVYLWLLHVDVWQKPIQYCKAIILQLKKKKRNQLTAPSSPQSGSEQGHHLLLVFTPFCSSTSPSEALPEFL